MPNLAAFYKNMSYPEPHIYDEKTEADRILPWLAVLGAGFMTYYHLLFVPVFVFTIALALQEETPRFFSTLLWRLRGDDWWEHPQVREIRRGLEDIEVGIESEERYSEPKESIGSFKQDIRWITQEIRRKI
jgi:hypothetical protein